eukprot:Gb_21864 [translate_table: standard]
MAKKIGVPTIVLLVLLLLIASEMQGAAARTCKSASKKYKRICTVNKNCATICKSEGFEGGECDNEHIVNRKCFCYKHC